MRVHKQLVIMATFMLAVSVSIGGINIIADGKMEDGTPPPPSTTVPGWHPAGGWVFSTVDDASGGGQCLEVTLTGGQSLTHMAINAPYICEAGDSFELSLAYKTSVGFDNSGDDGDNRVLVRFFDASQAQLGRIRIDLAPTNGVWQVVSDTGAAPAGTVSFDVIVLADWAGKSTGILRVDNVELSQAFAVLPTAGINYWIGDPDWPDASNWNVYNKWSLGRQPVDGDHVIVAEPGTLTARPVIDRETLDVEILAVAWHEGDHQTLDITDGAGVNVTDFTRLGSDPNTVGTVYMDGGTLNTPLLQVGFEGVGRFYHSGGIVNLDHLTDPLGFGYSGSAYYLSGDALLTLANDWTVEMNNYAVASQLVVPIGWALEMDYDDRVAGKTAVSSYFSGLELDGYWNGTEDADWNNPDNWGNGVVPDEDFLTPDFAIISGNSPPYYPVISSNIGELLYLAFNWHDAYTVSPAELTIDSGGYVYVHAAVAFNRELGGPSNAGHAILNLTGGGHMVASILTMSEDPSSTVRIYVEADSFIHMGAPIAWGNGDHIVDLKPGGSLVFNNDITGLVQPWIDEGKIIGNGDAWDVATHFDGTYTVVDAVEPQLCTIYLDSDLNQDCVVNLDDLMLLITEWLEPPFKFWQATMDSDPVASEDFFRRQDLSGADDYEIDNGLMVFNSTPNKGTINVLVDTFPLQIFDETVEIWASMRTTELGDNSPAVHAPCIFVPINTDQATFGMARFMMVKPNSSQQDLVLIVNENTEALRLSGFDPAQMVTFNALVDATGATKTVTIKSATDGTTIYTNQSINFTNGLSGMAGPTFVSLAGFGYSAEVDYVEYAADKNMAYDLSGDNKVNIEDFAVMASEWMDDTIGQ